MQIPTRSSLKDAFYHTARRRLDLGQIERSAMGGLKIPRAGRTYAQKDSADEAVPHFRGKREGSSPRKSRFGRWENRVLRGSAIEVVTFRRSITCPPPTSVGFDGRVGPSPASCREDRPRASQVSGDGCRLGGLPGCPAPGGQDFFGAVALLGVDGHRRDVAGLR